MAKNDIHKKHRERLRRRFLESGIDSFTDHQLFELLLFYAIPRRDTNEIAHRLVDVYGTVSGVFDAPYEDLQEIEGVGEIAASLLKLIPEISRRYIASKQDTGAIITSTDDACTYLIPKFIGRKDECVILLCLDSKRKVLYDGILFTGSVNSAQVSVRKIVEIVLRHNAASAILAHNHPGGIALPSGEDINTTERVRTALAAVHIELLDHIIVADSDAVSLADSGLLDVDE